MEQIRMLIWEAAVVIGALVRPAAKSVRENSGLAVISLVLAFGLWIFVTDAENPEQTRRPDFDIPVRPVNVPPDVWVPNVVGNTRVEVRVEDKVFDSLTKDDFEATADLTGLGVGDYDAPLTVVPVTDRGNLRVVDILNDNDKITVHLAQLVSKAVPVKLDLSGAPPEGYSIGTASVDRDTAVVSGARERVAPVTVAVAAVGIQGNTEPFKGSVRLEARNQQDALEQDVDVDPRTVDVSIEIQQISFSRALAVSPDVKGTPRAGYVSLGATVEPAVVTVFGPQAFIEQAVSILTEPIDIDDETGDVTRTVSLDLPPGTSVRGGANVTVNVKISPVPGQQVFAVPVSVDNLADNLKVAGTLPAVQVFLSGPAPDLLEIDPSDIKASVDLGGKDAGTHRVGVKVTLPNKFEVRSISPQEIEITLERR